jgi:hypothetical protein
VKTTPAALLLAGSKCLCMILSYKIAVAYLFAFSLRKHGPAYRVVDLIHRVHSNADQGHCTQAKFIRPMAIDLKNPTRPNVTKEVASIPQRREVEVHYHRLIGVMIPANDKRHKSVSLRIVEFEQKTILLPRNTTRERKESDTILLPQGKHSNSQSCDCSVVRGC